MIHELKELHQFYIGLEDGSKNFEIRKNDRDYKVGNILILKEYDPWTKKYSGRSLKKQITYILHHEVFPDGIKEGYVVIGLK